MPLFGGDGSPFDELVEKATNETRTTEDWALVLDICDRIASAGAKGARDGLTSVKKRLNHRDPHVTMLALSLLDSCWSNSGETFRREVSSREMVQELRHQATSSNYTVAEKTRTLIKKWSEDECKKDPSLSLVSSLYSELRQEGLSFEPSHPKAAKAKSSSDSADAAARREEDDLAKAIAESLKETSARPAAQATITSSPLYPSALGGGSSASSAKAKDPERVVKALYDFEAAEDNELTFKAGQHIRILDDSDMNWWKGRTERGEGLFPVSFVTSDLTQAVEGESGSGKKVGFSEEVGVAVVEAREEEAGVDEGQLDRCLELLADADPTGDRAEPEELAGLEEVCRRMAPLIDQELASLDRETNDLAAVDVKLRDALSLYNQAMSDATQQLQASMASASLQSQQPSAQAYQAQAPTSASYAPPAQSLDAYAQSQQPSLSHIPAYSAPQQTPQPHYVPQYQQ